MNQLTQRVRVAGQLTRRIAHLYRLAKGPAEWMSVTGLALHHLARRALPGRVAAETTLVLGGCSYTLGLGEAFVFEELYHTHLLDRLPDFVPSPGWIVFDIGANVGVFTVQQAVRGAQVFAFEPNPSCYRRLCRNLARNGLGESVTARNCALGRTRGLGGLVVGENTLVGRVVVNGARPDARAPLVTVEALDDLLPELGVAQIDLLKLDVEGSEAEVFRGAETTLRVVNRIVMEHHSLQLLAEVDALLSRHRFARVLRFDTGSEAGVGIAYYRRVDAVGDS